MPRRLAWTELSSSASQKKLLAARVREMQCFQEGHEARAGGLESRGGPAGKACEGAETSSLRVRATEAGKRVACRQWKCQSHLTGFNPETNEGMCCKPACKPQDAPPAKACDGGKSCKSWPNPAPGVTGARSLSAKLGAETRALAKVHTVPGTVRHGRAASAPPTSARNATKTCSQMPIVTLGATAAFPPCQGGWVCARRSENHANTCVSWVCRSCTQNQSQTPERNKRCKRG